MNTILVIDDDVYIGDMLEETLVREGYGVLRAYSGTEALLILDNNKPDLVLLDLMLPGLSGEELLPKISELPVIVVSAKGDCADKVKLLLGGAVDYVTKPFDMKELLARITVQLRRRDTMPQKTLHFGVLTLDLDTHIITANSNEARLTRTEFAILKLLMSNPSQVITKSQLLDRISLDTPDCVESSLKVHISNLRKKLRGISGSDMIEAVWGIGFKMIEGNT
ncbi:MAG: response regulator transcription factor [Clostridiales bacterium]|nr:response regulator transcription factor [Clostridiales bacterium]